MNKLKKHIEGLRDYLGKDSQGLSRLDQIARSANELRKDKTKLIEKNETKSAAIEREKEAVIREKKISDKLKLENEKQRNQVFRLEREVKKQTDEIVRIKNELAKFDLPELSIPKYDKQVDAISLSGNQGPSKAQLDIIAFTSMFNSLRKEMRKCPAVISQPIERLSVQNSEYELFDIIKNYSEEQMAKLGKMVASMAILNFNATVVSSVTFTNDVKNKCQISETTLGKFIRWFAPKNINLNDMESLARQGDVLIENTGKVANTTGRWGEYGYK